MNIGKMIGGVCILIGIYLFVSNGDKTAKVINSLASNSVYGIKVLQGRG
jgi:hypothetical protein